MIWSSQVVLVVKNLLPRAGNLSLQFDQWVEKIPWRRAGQHTPVFLPGQCHGQRSLASPLDRKELDMTEVTLHTLTCVCVCLCVCVCVCRFFRCVAFLLLKITFTW